MATNDNQKLAVLIDADNAQASVIQELLAEVSRYGTATIKRAYGDWTTQNLRGWKDVLHTWPSSHAAVRLHQRQKRHRLGADHRRHGRAAHRQRGRFLPGVQRQRLHSPGHPHPRGGAGGLRFGERKTPEPFVAACDKFIYTEILRTEPEEPNPASSLWLNCPSSNPYS